MQTWSHLVQQKKWEMHWNTARPSPPWPYIQMLSYIQILVVTSWRKTKHTNNEITAVLINQDAEMEIVQAA